MQSRSIWAQVLQVFYVVFRFPILPWSFSRRLANTEAPIFHFFELTGPKSKLSVSGRWSRFPFTVEMLFGKSPECIESSEIWYVEPFKTRSSRLPPCLCVSTNFCTFSNTKNLSPIGVLDSNGSPIVPSRSIRVQFTVNCEPLSFRDILRFWLTYNPDRTKPRIGPRLSWSTRT